MAPILRVAALQCDCSAPTTADNLRHIGALLASELSKLPSPPHLVLLPELFATGYNLDAGDPTNWARAERVPDSADGTADLSGSPTLAAMRDWSSAHRCVIGGTLLEASPDGHLYNTFVLFLPSGGGAAMHPLRVRKSRPASFEAFVFNGTPPGAQRTFEFAHPETGEPLRLAAAICYETVLPDVVASLCSSGKLDLLLLPFSAPDPIPSPAFPPADCSMFLSSLVSAPPMLARALGCHVLACNKAGGFETLTSRPLPFLPRIFPAMKGVGWIPLTMFVDAEGKAVSSVPKDEEGIAWGEVDLAAPRPPPEPQPKVDGPYAVPMPFAVRSGFPLMETIGAWSYVWAAGRRERVVTGIVEGAGGKMAVAENNVLRLEWYVLAAGAVGIGIWWTLRDH